ncbi:uncharacterized protein LOC108630250 [Ceratina calcarata]|uniref:Uncharacterized protein LOC108630250 n=1 Tax=Ceratina calcarata TaxID=156304 RepID=A0AAJ7JAN0_9HYME|nr:uncharacterized protein LOC108630250 [Ceratina calcarata]
MKPLLIQEYKKKHGITSLYPEAFLYYGLRGTDVLWSNSFSHLTFTRNTSDYTVLTKIYGDSGNISFWTKLWNPDDEKKGEAYILLTVLPIPASAEIIAEDWAAGVELAFSNSGSRQTFPAHDEDENYENSPEILIGTKWTGIWISWGGGFISAGIEGTMKPLLIQEYKKKHGITSLYPEAFLYYGLRGTDVLWSNSFCQTHCEMHTTFGIDFSKVWALQKHNDTIDVRFFIRASNKIYIRLYQTPVLEYPAVTVIIPFNTFNIIFLSYQESEESSKHYLKEISAKDLLDFWSWREFSISIFGSHFRIFSQKARGAVELVYMNENFLASLRWFSIGSENTTAFWTLFCSPDESDVVEDPWPPNCVSDVKDYQFVGSQWTSHNEVPCVPWISKEVPGEEKNDEKFVDGSALKALNKCRNPTHDPDGPYCYGYTPWQTETVTKRYCTIRPCRSSECKMAGTANDYVGKLSKTRSGRVCDKWPLSSEEMASKLTPPKPTAPKPARSAFMSPTFETIHENQLQRYFYGPHYFAFPTPVEHMKARSVPWKPKGIGGSKQISGRETFNSSMYPEGSATNASNYCRNPSRNIAGSWCYTTDPLLPRDLCNVKDCEKPEEFTFLVREDGSGRRIYVLPEYRSEGLRFSLKAWEPDNPDSVTFGFLAADGLKSRYVLKIGSANNEKVMLYYESETDSIQLVRRKALSHLLYVGKWSSFIIRIPRGQLSLFYEDDPMPLFEWTHPDPPNAFLPMYYYYGSDSGRAVAFAFDHDSNCHIENTKTDRYTRILSLSTWMEKEVLLPEQITFQLRGQGVFSVPLYLMPAVPGFSLLKFNNPQRLIWFAKTMYPSVTVYHKQKTRVPLFTTNSWTNITIKWSGNVIEIFSNGTNVFHYQHSNPLVFYFFSVGVESGNWVTWTANCMPTDGPPLDGGWSEWGPWACSASCNGGTGIRKRRCDSPKPNVKGEPCVGPSTMTGRCNEILCGDITEDTINLINRRIRTNHTALTVKEHHSVTLESDADIVKLITTESPRSELQWSLNGVFVLKEPGRLELKDYNIEITRAILNDSGVFAMTLHRIDGTYSIIKVISLAVIPARTNVQVRETLSATLQCHCTILGHVYSELHISWLLHNKMWKDYGVALPIAADTEHIQKINRTHNGMWQCVVKQTDLGFQWTTNMISVREYTERVLLEDLMRTGKTVLGAPNWRTHLMEDQATRFFFGWLPNEDYVGVFAICLFLILVGGIIIGSYQYIRLRETTRDILGLKDVVRSPRGSQYEPLTDDATTEDQGITEDQTTTEIEDEGTTETEDQVTTKYQDKSAFKTKY